MIYFEHPFSETQLFALMEEALVMAQKAWKAGEVPVGAVLVDTSGRILSKAHNSPIAAEDPTAHAEIVAMRQAAHTVANYRLPDTFMFVTLEPCIMCAGAMVWARIKGVFFGAFDKRAGALGSVMDINQVPGLNHRIMVSGGLLQDECAEVIRAFFRKRRRNGEKRRI